MTIKVLSGGLNQWIINLVEIKILAVALERVFLVVLKVELIALHVLSCRIDLGSPFH